MAFIVRNCNSEFAQLCPSVVVSQPIADRHSTEVQQGDQMIIER